MIECGVGHRILKKHLKKATLDCQQDQENRLSAIGFGEVFIPYAIIFSGFSFALGLLLIELAPIGNRFQLRI